MASVAAPPSAKPSDAARQRTEKILHAFHEEERFGRAYDLELLRRLWPFFVPQRRLLGAALGVVLFTAVGALIRPLVMRRVIDGGIMAGDATTLMHGGLLLAGIILVEQVLGFVQLYATQVAGARAMADYFIEGGVSLVTGGTDNHLMLINTVTNDVSPHSS